MIIRLQKLSFTIRPGCLLNHKWADQRVHTRLIPTLPLGGHHIDITYKGWGGPHSFTAVELCIEIPWDVDEKIGV